MKTETTALHRAARALARWMKRSNTSVVALATHLGVSRTGVSQWLAAENGMRLDAAIALDVLSAGAVPFELWGYDRSTLGMLADLLRMRGYGVVLAGNVA